MYEAPVPHPKLDPMHLDSSDGSAGGNGITHLFLSMSTLPVCSYEHQHKSEQIGGQGFRICVLEFFLFCNL